MAAIVPKSREPWTQEQPFRVEHLAVDVGSIQRVYFDGLPEAEAFAKHHRTYGAAGCLIESRDMRVTHRVYCSTPGGDYTFWIKLFGSIETARAEFEVGKARAQVSGGRFVLTAVGVTEPIDTYPNPGIES